jgi:hypothetical protein
MTRSYVLGSIALALVSLVSLAGCTAAGPAGAADDLRITPDEIAALADGETIALDLHGGAVYVLDAREAPIATSALVVITEDDAELPLAEWVGPVVIGRALRVGGHDALTASAAEGAEGTGVASADLLSTGGGGGGGLSFECNFFFCTCEGHDDCIDMWDNCPGSGWCDETDPNNPKCICFRASRAATGTTVTATTTTATLR